MKKTIRISEDEIKEIMRIHFKLKEKPIIYTFGGVINPISMEIIHFEGS